MRPQSAGSWSDAQIVVQLLKTGERKVLVQGGADGRYLPTGHLLYTRDGVVYANAFDVGRLELTGGPVSVIEGINQTFGAGVSGTTHLAVSQTGSLIYLPGDSGTSRVLVWRDRQGRETPIAAPARAYAHVRISPDGTRLALGVLDQESDIWVWGVAAETLTRVTFDSSSESFPVWTHDSKRIIYRSTKNGAPNLFWKLADGTGQAEALATAPVQQNPTAVSPDGKLLLFTQFNLTTGQDVMMMSLEGDRRPRPLIQTPFDDGLADISPDGKWMPTVQTSPTLPKFTCVHFPPWTRVAGRCRSMGEYGRRGPRTAESCSFNRANG